MNRYRITGLATLTAPNYRDAYRQLAEYFNELAVGDKPADLTGGLYLEGCSDNPDPSLFCIFEGDPRAGKGIHGPFPALESCLKREGMAGQCIAEVSLTDVVLLYVWDVEHNDWKNPDDTRVPW